MNIPTFFKFKFSTVLIFVALVFLTSFLNFFYYSASAQTVTQSQPINDTTTIQIEFKNPATLDSLLTKWDKYPVDEIILKSSFTFNNEVIQDFYVVNIKDKNQDIRADYIKNRKEFIADVKKITVLSPADTKNIENIFITQVTLTGKKSNIDEIGKGLDASKVDVANMQLSSAAQAVDKTKPKEASLAGDGKASITLTTVPMYLSVPTSGVSYFLPTTGGRYSEQHMKWNAINFAPDQTYEHKIYLYNGDRKTYLNGATTAYPYCYPTATYATTNWPSASRPYLDTRLSENLVSCEIDELSYTIGAAQASALQPNVDYWTYIRTINGNDTTDKFKLQAQVGYRNPSSCYTTWCAAKYKIYTIIPFSSGTAIPGTQSWTYKGQAPDAPSNVSVTNPTASSLRVNFIDNTFDETNILIERKAGSGSWMSLGGFGVLLGTGNWYWNNTGLVSKTTYCYRLKAINAIGSSAYSNQSCGITL